MKKIVLCISLFCAITFVYSQEVYPLNTFYQDVPDYSYIKDLDKELDQFLGVYKADYNGNQIILYITKQEKFFRDFGVDDKKFYFDRLLIRYSVKDKKGEVLQDTFQNDFPDEINEIFSLGINPSNKKSAFLHYRGTYCMVGWGKIILTIIDPKQLEWSFYAYDTNYTQDTCDIGLDINIYLPIVKKLIFLKQ